MAIKFRVGQSVLVGDEYEGVIVGTNHTNKGVRWLVALADGKEMAVETKNLGKAKGRTEGVGEVEAPLPLGSLATTPPASYNAPTEEVVEEETPEETTDE